MISPGLVVLLILAILVLIIIAKNARPVIGDGNGPDRPFTDDEGNDKQSAYLALGDEGLPPWIGQNVGVARSVSDTHRFSRLDDLFNE